MPKHASMNDCNAVVTDTATNVCVGMQHEFILLALITACLQTVIQYSRPFAAMSLPKL